jgi:hypothetical protein
VIASFLTLLALALVAIALNRRALRLTRGESSGRTDTLGWWSTGGLLLADLVAAVNPGVSFSLFTGLSVAVLTMAGAMAGVILSATALCRTRTPSPGGAPRRRDLRQLGARVGLVLASLLLLAGYVVTAFAAQFLASFLLLFVY